MSFPIISGFGILGGLFGLLFFIFWVWMLVDCAINERDTGSKIAWILIIIFANCIGAAVYFFVRVLRRKR